MSSPGPSEGAPVKIACLGDSLTGPAPGVDHLADYLKWTDLLQVGLDAVFGAGRVVVLNQGNAGETSSGLRAALDERLLRHAPRCAVLWIGANNYATTASHEETSLALAEDIRAMIGRAKGAGVALLLVQYPVPRAENMDRVWTHVDAGNDTIGGVAEETGTPVLDLRPAFCAAAGHMALASLASPVDGVHLRPGGEMVVARALLSKLVELGWPAIRPQLILENGPSAYGHFVYTKAGSVLALNP